MEMTWNDGLHPGSRRPRLYLAKGGEAVKFVGASIPGYCCIVSATFQKDGKWSNTTYRLALAPGVRAIHMLSPLHGTWGDDLSSWGAAAEALGLPVDVTRTVVRGEYPGTAERLDEVERFALAVEAEGATSELVVMCFGSPTNKAAREGYWSSPKSGRTSDGRTVTVQPGPNNSWTDPEVVEPPGAKVVSSRHTPGHHGGYYTVEVAVPVYAAP